MKPTPIPFLLMLFMLSLLMACTPATPTTETGTTPEGVSGFAGKADKIVIFLGRGGRGDNSFNDAAASTLPQLSERGVQVVFEDYPAGTPDEAKGTQLASIERYITEGVDLFIGIGFENAPVITEAAQSHPDTRFAMIDVAPEQSSPNLTAITFREPEGDYILGVLAAHLTESGRVGFIGGAPIPVIERIGNGYSQGVEAGVAEMGKPVEVVVELIGSFTDTVKARETATTVFSTQDEDGNSVDVVYIAAGAAGNEAIKTAMEQDVAVLSTSTTINLPPGVMAARPKRVDTAVLFLVDRLRAGTLDEQPHYSLGYREEGLGLEFSPEVDAELRVQMEALQKQIVSGMLVVEVAEDGMTVSVYEN